MLEERFKLSIIILTMNKWELTSSCLESLVESINRPYEIIIVDNGSSDGTLQQVQRLTLLERPKVRLLANSSNVGFAAGCNQGMRAATGSHILLLNNDTLLAGKWLEPLLAALHSRPDVGIVGPVSNYVLPMQLVVPGYSDLSTYKPFARFFNRHDPAQWREVTALSGFCMLFRRELMERIGLFDEQFGHGGYEDIDYGYRVLQNGLKLIVAGHVHVHHVGNASFRANHVDMEGIAVHNRRLFLHKWGFNPERLFLTTNLEFLHHSGRLGHLQGRRLAGAQQAERGQQLPDGLYVRNEQGSTYQLFRGLKRPVVSLSALQALRVAPAQLVPLPQERLQSFGDGPALNPASSNLHQFPVAFAASDPAGGMYWICDGLRYPIRSRSVLELLQLQIDEVIPVPAHLLRDLPEGDTIGADAKDNHELLHGRLYASETGGYYYAESGRLRAIGSPGVLEAYRWTHRQPIRLSAQQLARQLQGPPIPWL